MSIASERVVSEAPPVPTPCIGVCEIDTATGLCRGCARTGDEVAAWQNADEHEKSAIWNALPARRSVFPMNAYRLAWPHLDIAAMIERTLRHRLGYWQFGVPGASARFEIQPDEHAEIQNSASAVTAITAKGALRLLKHQKTIAVAFGNTASACDPEAIGLILPRGRIALRDHDRFTSIGQDRNAISPAHRENQLFDLGLSKTLPARFCLRTTDQQSLAQLSAHAGRGWRDMPRKLSGLHSIVETGLGRIETFAPPLEADIAGTSAHLNWQDANEIQELPNAWTLKPVFALCALFYPSDRQPADAFLDGPV